jgi:hypothetical protein
VHELLDSGQLRLDRHWRRVLDEVDPAKEPGLADLVEAAREYGQSKGALIP